MASTFASEHSSPDEQGRPLSSPPSLERESRELRDLEERLPELEREVTSLEATPDVKEGQKATGISKTPIFRKRTGEQRRRANFDSQRTQDLRERVGDVKEMLPVLSARSKDALNQRVNNFRKRNLLP